MKVHGNQTLSELFGTDCRSLVLQYDTSFYKLLLLLVLSSRSKEYLTLPLQCMWRLITGSGKSQLTTAWSAGVSNDLPVLEGPEQQTASCQTQLNTSSNHLQSSTWRFTPQLAACAVVTDDAGIGDCADHCDYNAGNGLRGKHQLVNTDKITRPRPWSCFAIWALPLLWSRRRKGSWNMPFHLSRRRLPMLRLGSRSPILNPSS